MVRCNFGIGSESEEHSLGVDDQSSEDIILVELTMKILSGFDRVCNSDLS